MNYIINSAIKILGGLAGGLLKHWKIVLPIMLFFAVAGGGWYLWHGWNKAEQKAEAERQENNRLKQQNEGMKILLNTETVAREVDKLKEKANEQQRNSNLANVEFNNSVQRDSGTFAGNYNAARKRFCENFPEDSRCRK